MNTSTILLAGGTGLIGTRLSEKLRTKGHTVRLLTRSPKGDFQFFWNPQTEEIDANALQNVDYVINLAGAGIADRRWTLARKKELIESRVLSAALLHREMERMTKRPKAYLSASAIGIYGNSGEQWMAEHTTAADAGFMVDCCQQWEAAAASMKRLGIRTLTFRIGVVLAKEGGALAEIVRPLRFGLGAYFGDGKAWWSWIHREDVCNAFIWGLEQPSLEGIYNLTAPSPVRGKALVQSTAQARAQWAIFLPVPAWGLKLLFGEMAAVILNSNRVSADKLLQTGFEFEWPELGPALGEIFNN